MFDVLSRDDYLGQTHLTQRWVGREDLQTQQSRVLGVCIVLTNKETKFM